MRIEQFTLKAQEAIQAGQTLARRMGSPEFEPEHLAKALLTQEQGVAEALLRRIGTDPGLVQGRIDEALERLPRIQGGDGSRLSQRLLRDFDKAEDEA
ncbi:MAG: Clp protease N-terminal domain-containing protein, partial [Myxococcaceae bacterium]